MWDGPGYDAGGMLGKAVICFLAMAACPVVASAQEARELFNGTDFEGWTFDVISSQVEPGEIWSVRNTRSDLPAERGEGGAFPQHPDRAAKQRNPEGTRIASRSVSLDHLKFPLAPLPGIYIMSALHHYAPFSPYC